MSKRIYLLAGEASGDAHGAALMEALRESDAAVQFTGRGGPRMAALGDVRNWVAEAAVVGLWEVIKRYGYFRREFAATLAEIAQARPDAVVLIDYPGFNLRIARALRRSGTTARIIYYISPQVWAWNRARIPHMARTLDLMLCIFPFEADMYNASGLRTVFVGHPMIHSLRARQQSVERESNLVGLFPGSRSREVRSLFPLMLETAETMIAQNPALRFEVAAASEALAADINGMLATSGPLAHRFTITVGEAASLMQRAAFGIVASGTATLEAAFFRMPFVLVYRVAWPTYFAARAVVKVKYLGMPNVLAGREIVPEFIQHRARPDAVAQAALRFLNDENARALVIREFDAIIGKLGETEASKTAARAILHELERTK